MYEYKAIINKVIDGDTVDLIVDLGFNISIKKKFRVLKLNTSKKK